MKIKTKSGFVCDVNQNKLKDWRYVKAAARAAKSNDQAEILDAVGFMINFMLGDEYEAKLMEHVTDKEGVVDSALMQNEFEEITKLMGEEIKKSTSSQA